jgi:hypothetical protein
MTLLDPILDIFRGKAITIPPLDGAFRPNAALDEARQVASLNSPDEIIRTSDGTILVASHCDLVSLDADHEATTIARFNAGITALAALPGGSVIVGLDDGNLLRWRAGGEAEPLGIDGVRCPTAITVLDERTILVAQGSLSLRPTEWRRDLLERNATGAVWQVDLAGRKSKQLTGGLAFPNGLAISQDRKHVVVSEAWRNRLVEIPIGGGAPRTVLADLPGYPSRLSDAEGEGYWLALFAPRNRLIEFVLGEDRFRRNMLADVPEEHWIAPTLSPASTFLEPLQCGSVRTMGVSKAWAPTRSYGLVVRLDRDLRPVSSFHSRANGKRHGTTSVLDLGSSILVAAKGSDVVIALEGTAQ